MNPIRRELLNGLFVLVVASLLSAAFAAFQVEINLQLWVWILTGVVVAVGFYLMFDLTLRYIASTEARETALAEATRLREAEWLKRVGTPARMELNQEGETTAIVAVADSVKSMSPGSDYTAMYYVGPEGGSETPLGKEVNAIRHKNFNSVLDQLKRGTIREYKRIICFDHDVLANNPELRSGVLRVGQTPGTIDRMLGEHCRQMIETKGCSLYVAPAVLRSVIVLYGANKVSMSVEGAEQDTGERRAAGVIFFSDPPNGEIIEQFRQLERATEKRMVAVHKIVFPEDSTAPQLASR
jgi:hypothetical protein